MNEDTVELYSIGGCEYCTRLYMMLKKSGFTVIKKVRTGNLGDEEYPFCIYHGRKYNYDEAKKELCKWQPKSNSVNAAVETVQN